MRVLRVGRGRYRWVTAIVLIAVQVSVLIAVESVGVNAALVKFGSRLSTDDSQPHPGQFCSDDHPTACTWVLVEGYQNPDRTNAQRAGTIKKIRLVASGPGSFRLFIARARPNQDKAKVVRMGPLINYQGGDDKAPYTIETFNVNVRVNEGDYLAVRAKRVRFLNCSGQEVLTYQPPLQVGGPFRVTDPDSPGCTMLIQAMMR